MDYLKSFPRADDLAIGSIKINLDYLIFQKQRQNNNSETKTSLVEMNFLKTKGQHQLNKQMIYAGNGKPAENPATKMIVPFYKSLTEEEEKNTL
mmetsp:Transcript_21220/g.32877  ORF Transcript_21220/g.32877 Transcript_21220/m.32877 type:complete len:94 (+) Transcript_21220:1283-1564(+)